MSKLNAIKEKLSGLKSQLAEKADKIAFLKTWREKRAASQPPAGPERKDNLSVSTIYKEGSTFTRLQVILFLALALIAFVSTGSLALKLASKLKSFSGHEKIKQDYSHELAEVKRKSMEKVEMLMLGQFTTNAYVGPGKEPKMMSIDLWIRVSDPEAAALVNNRTAVFHDKTSEALNDLYLKKVSFLTDQGKIQARQAIRDALGTALPKGHTVEEVFIHNLVLQ